MKTHTSQFKEDIKTVGKQLDSKITFKVNGVAQTLTSEDLNGVTPTFQGAILKSVMKELDIDSNVNIPIGTEVNYQFGVKLENNFEYLDYGNYIVYSSEKQEDTNSYKIICYDKMLYSMKQNEDLEITYPISIRNYINALCTKIGLEFKNKNDKFANFDRVLDKELYVGLDYTYRDILDELAQVTASTICLDNKDKVEIRYINDLTELNEVVGTSVNINDSIDYKLNSLTLYGKSTQATRSGKNLYNNADIVATSDASIIKSSTGFTATRTSSSTGDLFVGSYEKQLKPNTTYTFYENRTNGSTCYFYSDNLFGTVLTRNIVKSTDTLVIYTFTTDSTGKVVIGFYSASQTQGDTVTLSNIMLLEGSYTSETIPDYEPYGVMPSPDYPSPIESVGRKNLLKNTLVNETKNGITLKVNEDKSIILSGTATKDTPFYFMMPANSLLLKQGTYTLSGNNSNSSNVKLLIHTKDWKLLGNNLIGGTTFTLNENTEVFVYAWVANGATINTTMYPMLEAGNTKTDYVPYEHTEIGATVTGKNLFDLEGYILSRGSTYTKNSDGSFLVNTSGPLYNKPYQFSETDIDVSLSGLITLGTATYVRIQLLNNKDDVIGEITSSRPTVLNKKACKIRFNWTNQGTFTLKDVMLEKGTVATEYEEYKSNSLAIDLQGNELCSLPDGTKDEVNITNGEALLTKRIGKVVLDGSENWENYTNLGNNSRCYYVKPNTFGLRSQLFSNYFIKSNLYETDETGITINPYGTSLMAVKIPNSALTTQDLTGFKAWLSTHNVEVLYELAEPETINLGTVEIPHTYDGVSNITNSADTEMVVKYSKGWETINEEYLKDINVNFGQKYGPVNSVVLTRGAESDNIYLQDENSIAQNGLCEIKIADNQIMNWNDRSDYLPDILEKLDGLEYYLNDFSSTGIAYLDLCDRYNIEVFENTYSCVMFNDELLVTQGLEENVHTDMPEETETDYTKADKTDRKINNVSLIVDKQEQKINALAEKIQDISNTISGTGVITLTECNQTPLYKLVITGDDSLLFSNNKLFPSATTYLKSSTLYVNKGTDYEAIYDLKIPALRTLGSVKDEYIMENGKAKLIKRIGLNNNLQKYVLDTPIETDLGEMIINLKEGENTLEMPSFPAFRHTATYLLQNEYTDVFASQAQVTSQINIANDEVLIESKSQILGNGDELIASINTTSTGNVKIKASDTIALEGTTTVGDKIMFNLDGSITAQDLRLLDGGKVIGGDGLLTSMQFESVGQYNGFQFLGFNYNANNEVYKTSVSTTFNIPENFVVVSAYATLLHTPINFWDFNNTSITGSAKNLKLYKDFSANVDKIYAGFNSGYWIENNNLTGDEITNAFGSATYTPANSQSGALVSKTSIDIKDYISTGLNTLFVRTTDSTSSTSSNSTDACKKTGCAKLIVQVIGYTNFK